MQVSSILCRWKQSGKILRRDTATQLTITEPVVLTGRHAHTFQNWKRFVSVTVQPLHEKHLYARYNVLVLKLRLKANNTIWVIRPTEQTKTTIVVALHASFGMTINK